MEDNKKIQGQLNQRLCLMSESTREIIKIKKLDGDKFSVKLESKWFTKGDILNISGIVCRVVTVRKFTWGRKLLFKFGIKFYSMDLKQIK